MPAATKANAAQRMQMRYGFNEVAGWWHMAMAEDSAKVRARLRLMDTNVIRIFAFDMRDEWHETIQSPGPIEFLCAPCRKQHQGLTFPVVDTVTINRAEYQRSKSSLRVDASGSDPSATLRVYVTSSGTLLGTLKNNGGGRFSATFAWPTNPVNITVKSSLNGSASKDVTLK